MGYLSGYAKKQGHKDDKEKESSMKIKHDIFIGFAVIAVVAIFTLAGCEPDGGGTSVAVTDSTSTVEPFVAVTSFRKDSYLAGQPILVAEVGEPIVLNDKYRVYPANATNKTIVWSVKDAGTTDVTIIENVLTATTMGDAIVTGTVANGKAVGTPFTADSTVTVRGRW
jgi:hypothetical protein